VKSVVLMSARTTKKPMIAPLTAARPMLASDESIDELPSRSTTTASSLPAGRVRTASTSRAAVSIASRSTSTTTSPACMTPSAGKSSTTSTTPGAASGDRHRHPDGPSGRRRGDLAALPEGLAFDAGVLGGTHPARVEVRQGYDLPVTSEGRPQRTQRAAAAE